jgi:uncharacterized protein YbjT (DUF2867 family)
MVRTRIAVAGATGWTGRAVVAALASAGHETVPLARSLGVDLMTGDGLADRLQDVDAVVDVTNVSTTRGSVAREFFERVTTTLLRAEEQAGVGHHVVLSIVGVDRVDLGYYTGKRRQEELALTGRIPSTVVRATQFHEFAAQMLQRRGPLVVVPRMLCQPIALSEVADHLVSVATGDPLGIAPELAGPAEQLRMEAMVRALARSTGVRRPVVPLRLPGAVGRSLVGGGLLPTSDGPRGTVTYGDWLDARSLPAHPTPVGRP